MAWFCFPGAVSGLDVQSQNFGMEGGNVRDRMDSPKLCRKLRFRILGKAGHNQVFWVASQPGRHASYVSTWQLRCVRQALGRDRDSFWIINLFIYSVSFVACFKY